MCYGKNWMHFVYKLDNTAKTGCTSCTNWTISFEVSGFQTKTHLLHRQFKILITYYNYGLFWRSAGAIRSQVINFQPFLTKFAIFNAFTDLFWAKWPEIEKHYKWTLKRLKLGMVSSFHPHSMCKNVERVTTITGCASCTKRTISFEVSGFHTETRLLHRDFIFWTYLNSIVFLCSKCTIQSHIINFQPFLASFVIFHAFTNYFEL